MACSTSGSTEWKSVRGARSGCEATPRSRTPSSGSAFFITRSTAWKASYSTMSSPRPSASAAVEIGVIALLLAACEPIVFIARNPEGGAANDPCADAPAEWYFCSGFEEGDLASVWDDFDGHPSATDQLLEDPGPHGASGNHVARLL